MPTAEQREIETRVRSALEALVRGDTTAWTGLFAADGVQEFPYAPEGSPRRVEGRDAIAEYLAAYPETLRLHRIGPIAWRHDGGVAIAEFEVEGTAVRTGKPYDQRYISVIEHRGGEVARYVDYWNPLVVLEALGSAYK